MVTPESPGSARPAAEFRLGDWLVRPERCQLVSGARVVRLRPKLMDVLTYLADRPGRVVSREELLDAVWSKRFVAEATLAQAVFELRGALGDDRRAARFIETIPKRGYRLVAPVGTVRAATPGVPGCVLVMGDQEVALAPGANVIGRAPDAAVRLDLFEVSRHHARIVVSGDGATVEDLGSKNGTFVGGNRVSAPTLLRDGDEVLVGPALLVFRELAAAPTRTRSG